jgi:CheY-like chemotaxis protein
VALEIRVLVVEDDPETRMLTEALLSGRKGVCLCALAKDGLEGLELVEQTRPDIVLLDLILPGMDGLDFLRTLRRRNERPAVVVASQASEPTVIRLAFQLGASYYLIKPLNFDSLPDLFHSLCLEPRERAAADYLRGMGASGLGVEAGRALHGRGGGHSAQGGVCRRHGGPKHQLRLRGEKHPLHGGQAPGRGLRGVSGPHGRPSGRTAQQRALSPPAGPADFGVVAPRFP